MKIHTTSKSSLFLVEFMVIFIMFALAVVVCVGFFMKAHDASTYSKDLTTGTLVAMSVAEEFKGGESIPYTAFYNEEGNKEKSGIYRVDVLQAKNGRLLTADITVSKKEIILYELLVKHCQDGDEVR